MTRATTTFLVRGRVEPRKADNSVQAEAANNRVTCDFQSCGSKTCNHFTFPTAHGLCVCKKAPQRAKQYVTTFRGKASREVWSCDSYPSLHSYPARLTRETQDKLTAVSRMALNGNSP